MLHKFIKNIHKLELNKYYYAMAKLSIKNKKLLVDAMIKTFKSMSATAITFSNIKKN